MPSKLNTEFNYRYQVMGETVWERIKILKGFLEGRERAADMQAVTALKRRAAEAKLQYLKDTGAPEYQILELEADILEGKSFEKTEHELYDLNRQELEILNRYLKECYEIAEPTRVPGYTDEEMFEYNAANEFTAMIGREIYAEILSTGRPSPAKLRNAMSNPVTWTALQHAGLIPMNAHRVIGSNDPDNVGLIAVDQDGKEIDPLQLQNSVAALSDAKPE